MNRSMEGLSVETVSGGGGGFAKFYRSIFNSYSTSKND
jgi:hypothetical protein